MSYASPSVLHTFDASTCKASLNAIENIDTNEKSLMPCGIEHDQATTPKHPTNQSHTK